MATRSLIGIVNEDKTVDVIYCHYDGYPTGVGKMLVEHYNTEEKVRELIALGNLSSIHERIAPNKDEKHSFDKPAKGVTVAYCRDRGESWLDNATIRYTDTEEVKEEFDSSWCDYLYLFIDGAWHVLIDEEMMLVSKILAVTEYTR